MNHPNSQSLDWDDVRIFVAICRHGSFRKAADILGVGHTTLSRRIDTLETRLNTKLLNRLPTGLTLTTAGEEMFASAAALEDGFAELEVKMFGQDLEAKGKIKFTVPVMLLTYVLLKPITEFRKFWPDIEIEFDHTFGIRDLSAKEADLALRITENPAEELIGKRVGTYCEAAYATASYLKRHKKGADHAWLCPGNYQFNANLYPKYRGDLVPLVTLPDPDTQRAAALKHLGVATLPCIIGEAEKALIRISEVQRRSGIWLLTHKDARGNRRMQLFRDFLIEALRENEAVLEGRT